MRKRTIISLIVVILFLASVIGCTCPCNKIYLHKSRLTKNYKSVNVEHNGPVSNYSDLSSSDLGKTGRTN